MNNAQNTIRAVTSRDGTIPSSRKDKLKYYLVSKSDPENGNWISEDVLLDKSLDEVCQAMDFMPQDKDTLTLADFGTAFFTNQHVEIQQPNSKWLTAAIIDMDVAKRQAMIRYTESLKTELVFYERLQQCRSESDLQLILPKRKQKEIKQSKVTTGKRRSMPRRNCFGRSVGYYADIPDRVFQQNTVVPRKQTRTKKPKTKCKKPKTCSGPFALVKPPAVIADSNLEDVAYEKQMAFLIDRAQTLGKNARRAWIEFIND
eukprot:m.342938 g.342938  ORF g.342938 m.342938 type:complete len:259 (+) comp22061_c0_seq1:510-1286(+)